MTINKFYHPTYVSDSADWDKFRLTASGGTRFIERYLVKYSSKETDADFNTRLSLTYSPSFAKAAVNDIKNSIFQRLEDVSRLGGPDSYQKAIKGEGWGINKQGSSMKSFLGDVVLPELLTISKVGIYVDRDPIGNTPSLRDTKENPPYIYMYRAEQIRHWKFNNARELSSILLEEVEPIFDDEFNFHTGDRDILKLLQIHPDGVLVTKFKVNGELLEESRLLKIKRIPFVLGKLKHSLYQDVADYQIAMLNLSSSDLNYALRSNFPFYTEQVSTAELQFNKANAGKKSQSRKTGATQGKLYNQGNDRPGFINPSSEPLKVSMEKQAQMKEEIRELVNLSVASMGQDRGLEAGLSYIGLELERIEREIAKFWAMYEDEEPSVVDYPSNYSIKSDKERYEEAIQLVEIRKTVPSLTFKKELTKQIVDVVIGSKINAAEQRKINSEIDNAPVIIVDPEKIKDDVEMGLVSPTLASEASGYPKGEADKAQASKAERAIETLKAQVAFGTKGVDNNATNLGARGAGTNQEDKDNAKGEKEVTKVVKEVS